MMGSEQEADYLLGNSSESAGTLAGQDNVPSDFQLPLNASASSSMEQINVVPADGEEQALESHEVIELQAFSERKAWIEEKIKLLEEMPPIDVFVGLDSIRSSAEEVPGLPTRAELQKWLVDHDIIEKETEIFDSGELRKLKKFTKAATQRNLSPEDTDLIELTLTTIYELDKLLHLLRDRSENLDLLGIRLTWEEHRTAAWVERRKILADLQSFLDDRARWSPSVYDSVSVTEQPSNRRGSIASIASIASESSLVSSPGFSRSSRFKLAELLSRDAAQFSARVSLLRHGKIAAAGKALDKLIDHSRRPVPEALLDEQDKLEEKGINDLEQIGKFIMSVVMQWRKADEIYVETMKDHLAAQNLMEEIETSKLHHPTARQSTAFISRADTLVKRLALRGNPISSASTFPRPTHPLFTDQQASNETLAKGLSSDIIVATDLVKSVDLLAKEYRSTFEAVQDADTLCQSASDLSATFTSLSGRFTKGVSAPEGDGSPPDLSSETCLEVNQHSVFLALLPSILNEHDKAEETASQLLRRSQVILLRLDRPGIDAAYKATAASEIQRLTSLYDYTRTSRIDIIARVSRLREARRIWTIMGVNLRELESIKRQVGEAMETRRWHQQVRHDGAPPTPESPTTTSPLPSSIPTATTSFRTCLGEIQTKFSSDIELPLGTLSLSLESSLADWLSKSFQGLKHLLESVREMAQLLDSVEKQADIMCNIRDEFNEFQMRIENLKLRFDQGIHEVLADKLLDAELPETESGLKTSTHHLRETVQTFVNGLSQRVLFVSPNHSSSHRFIKKRFSSVDLKLGVPQQTSIELPFELSTLDDAVRGDSNLYAMRLGGELQGLDRKVNHLHLAIMAREVDTGLSSIVGNINRASQQLYAFKSAVSDTSHRQDGVSEILHSLSEEVKTLSQECRPRIARSFSPIRELLRRMIASPDSHDAAVHEVTYVARSRAVDDAELKFNVWTEDLVSLQHQISEAQQVEAQRIEDERKAEELRLQAERERIAAEEAEKVRLEQERLEAAERARIEEERLAAERLIKEEQEREKAQEAEKVRVEAEMLRVLEEECRLQAEKERIAAEEAERLRIMEEERLAEERRLQAEKERIAAEEAERLRVLEEERRLQAEKERIAAEEAERLRVMEEERRLQAEKERIAAEEAEKVRVVAERLRVMEEERRLQAEKDRIAAEEAESVRVEAERLRLEEERLAEERQLKEEQEREAAQEAEKVRLEAERIKVEEEEKARVEKERLREQERLASEHDHQAERECIAAEEAEKAEKARLEVERLRREEDRLGERHRLQAEEEHIATEKVRLEVERVRGEGNTLRADVFASLQEVDEDVFGLRIAPSGSHQSMSTEMNNLQAHILSLRKRLRALSINEVARPSSSSSSRLPDQIQATRLSENFTSISDEVAQLPRLVEDPSVDVELRSLRAEVVASADLLDRIQNLAHLTHSIHHCDTVLSDLLEHIDSFPALPLGTLSPYIVPIGLTPEEQLMARLVHVKSIVEEMTSRFNHVASDPRAVSERQRILQTWSELEDMGNDRVGGKKSRPSSVISSGRNSSHSAGSNKVTGQKKTHAYSNLSVRSSSRGRFLAPSTPRRAVSGSTESQSRPSSQLSTISSNRSVSGPLSRTLYGSTFASRQRTTSLSTSTSSPAKRPPITPSHSRAQTGQTKRTSSPAFSDASHSHSHSGMSASRSSSSMSTWARAPRQSLTTFPIGSPPRRKVNIQPKKTYIANPKNKLDVAVGDVVNKLPVNINIEVVADTWKDQSGKYWIGDQDPKLCFCRILRSRTVMVRVGGGWSELSKFIKDHFADIFRLIPDSPPRAGAQEEKWISSVTLLEAPEIVETSPMPPRTPEPKGSYMPSFSLISPNGNSPRSLRSTPSASGSPLTPLQFMRRADADAPIVRPSTPSKSSLRSRTILPHAPARNSVWRP